MPVVAVADLIQQAQASSWEQSFGSDHSFTTNPRTTFTSFTASRVHHEHVVYQSHAVKIPALREYDKVKYFDLDAKPHRTHHRRAAKFFGGFPLEASHHGMRPKQWTTNNPHYAPTKSKPPTSASSFVVISPPVRHRHVFKQNSPLSTSFYSSPKYKPKTAAEKRARHRGNARVGPTKKLSPWRKTSFDDKGNLINRIRKPGSRNASFADKGQRIHAHLNNPEVEEMKLVRNGLTPKHPKKIARTMDYSPGRDGGPPEDRMRKRREEEDAKREQEGKKPLQEHQKAGQATPRPDLLGEKKMKEKAQKEAERAGLPTADEHKTMGKRDQQVLKLKLKRKSLKDSMIEISREKTDDASAPADMILTTTVRRAAPRAIKRHHKTGLTETVGVKKADAKPVKKKTVPN